MSTLPRPVDHAGLEVLTLAECVALLEEGYVGRLAFVDRGEPAILPVNYRTHHGSIVFRTAIGSKLDAAAVGRPAAFEVDGIDETYHSGWSVLLKGRLVEVDDASEVAALETLRLRPWAAAVERPYWVRLVPTEISGRRIP
ncbi:MAG: pyridoxamine 5'-phosphate oxidase family protein [Actinomycetes bacterium]